MLEIGLLIISIYCWDLFWQNNLGIIVEKKSGFLRSGKVTITAIPRDMLPLDMLTPQIRHYELRQKNSRYANFSDFLPPAMLFLVFFQKNSRYANFSDLSTPSYAIFD